MAARFLKNKGYLVLETNYRCRWGEIDIVAVDEGQIVFVEVRTRNGNEFGTPEESITPAKKSRLVVTAEYYLGDHGPRRTGLACGLDRNSLGLRATTRAG